jgi:hypothetical protein
MATTKAHIIDLLAEPECKVIALAGKWGTGKSHMWDEIKREAKNKNISNALYVSLFGVATILDLKLKLAQSAVPLGSTKGPAMDAAISAIKGAKKIAASFFKGASALDEFALLAVPALVRNKFIVLDDIERKHSKLSIDEILGFIDDFTQTYECRMLLILNTDQLADKTIWEQFREKVIDQELRLETTPAEAFDIAVRLTPSTLQEEIKSAAAICGITNIRIIRKIIRAVNRIIVEREPLPSEILQRLIPSTVLLSAVHYKGIENGPTVDFILRPDAISAGMDAYRRREQGIETEEDKQHARWELLMRNLGIHGVDEYEVLAADYLKSGLFDRSKLDKIIDRYLADARLIGAKRRARSFLEACIYQPELTDQQLIDSAHALLSDIPLLSPFEVTALSHDVANLHGGNALSKKMIDAWIVHLHELAEEEGTDPRSFILDNHFNQDIHPDIAAAYHQTYHTFKKQRSLLEVCLWMADRNGWNPDEEEVMKSSTAEDFKKTILSINGDQLRTFMLKNLDIYNNKHTYSKHFGAAPENFFEACKDILQERPGTRWEKMIKALFGNIEIASSLATSSDFPKETSLSGSSQ